MVDLLLMVIVTMLIGIFGIAIIFGIIYNDRFQALARQKSNKKRMVENDNPMVKAAMLAIMDLPSLEGTEKGYDVEEVAITVINAVWELIEDDIRKDFEQRESDKWVEVDDYEGDNSTRVEDTDQRITDQG